MIGLKFKYVNLRDELHEYVVTPTDAALVKLQHATDTDEPVPVLHAEIITRDGDERAELGISGRRRRTFRIARMRDIEEVVVGEKSPAPSRSPLAQAIGERVPNPDGC